MLPGSPAALAADREKERARKRAYRAQRRAEDPPALPARFPGVVDSPAPAPDALAALPGGPPDDFVAWDPETLRPVFEQLLPPTEQMSVARLTSRAARAHLPPDLLAEIEKDARWAPPAKAAVLQSAPQVAAKWLNESGISAENQAEVVLLTAVSAIVASHLMLSSRLEKFIAEQNRSAPPPRPVEKVKE